MAVKGGKVPKEIRSQRSKLGHVRRVQRIMNRYKDGAQDKCVSIYNAVCECGHCQCLHAPVLPNLLFYGQCERCDCPMHQMLLDLPKADFDKALADRETVKLLIADGTLPKLLTADDLAVHRKFNQSKQ